LAAEGLIYFLLAILDFASHHTPNIQNSLPNFKALDIVIGGLPKC
jgi:hypothetical protein